MQQGILAPGQVFVSFDVEANGPVPGVFSMLSLGAVAFDHQGNEIDSFQINIHELPDARRDPDTMKWWSEQGEAVWAAIRENEVAPDVAMHQFASWVKGLPGKPLAMAYPAGWDWMYLYWYLIRFNGRSPFGFQCLDMKTLAAKVLDRPFRSVGKRIMPKRWFKPGLKHTHIPVDDAREQGHMFFAMVQDEGR